MEEIKYHLLPEGAQSGMQLWIERGIYPGSFLTAVLNNDLMGACIAADHLNQSLLYDYAKWLVNHAPSRCYGSRVNVVAWEQDRSAKWEARIKAEEDRTRV
jgi:hypothetical protein